MLLTDSWVEISSGTVQIQKSSAGSISLCYALEEPTTETTFVLTDTKPVVYHASNTQGMKLYARAKTGKTKVINVVQLHTQSSDLVSKARIGRIVTAVHDKIMAVDGVLDFCVLTGDRVVTVESIILGTTSIQATVELFESSVFTDGSGTQIDLLNRNRNYKDEVFPIQDFEADPTIVNEGNSITSIVVYGETGVGSGKSVLGQGCNNLPIIFEPNTGYTIRITNNDVSSRNFRTSIHMSN